MVWRDGEGADGGQHGKACGLVDVDAVDGCGVDLCDGEGEGGGADEVVERFALRTCELLGVLEASVGERTELFWQDDGCGNYRSKERTTTDFVHACDGAEAFASQGLFVRAGANQKLEHALLCASR